MVLNLYQQDIGCESTKYLRTYVLLLALEMGTERRKDDEELPKRQPGGSCG